LSLLRVEGDEREIAFAVFKHCNIARANGDFSSPVFQESLDRHRALNDLPGVARALNALAIGFQARGDYAEAKKLYHESVHMYRRVGLDGEAWAPLNNLAAIAMIEDDAQTARKIMEDELVHARRRNHPLALSFLLTNLAHICQLSGDVDAAESYLAEGIQLSREMGYRTRLAYALNTLATIQLARGEVANATQGYREALHVAVQAEEQPIITDTLVSIARLLMQRNQAKRGAEILHAVIAHPSTDEETRSSAKSILDAQPSAVAKPRESTISFDDAVATALEIDDRLVVA
jgi:tetratricopeptide (TPR) repeat protein